MTAEVSDLGTALLDKDPGTDEREILLSVRQLKKYFPIMKGVFKRQVGAVRAVDDVSFDVYRGETLGLVGESGSGKSTIGRVILQLDPATAGTVVFEGKELTTATAKEVRKLRPRMQMVFQDPHASLNPRMTVASIIGEPLVENGVSKRERTKIIDDLLRIVGLDPTHGSRYPHEFSGGQRQRIGVARAIALNPDFIVCDEPIAALGCLDSGSGRQSLGATPRRVEPDLPFHLSRPFHGASFGRSGGGAISGSHRRIGQGR